MEVKIIIQIVIAVIGGIGGVLVIAGFILSAKRKNKHGND